MKKSEKWDAMTQTYQKNHKESKKYIWCNYKECISPVTVTIGDERTIILLQQDHENLSKLLPKMREIEKKQEIEEKKEKGGSNKKRQVLQKI